MVVGLGVRPSVCLGQILQSSDVVRSGNGVLAFGTKEFRNLVLLSSEVEICGPVGPCSCWYGGDIPLSGGVAGVVIVGLDVDVSVVKIIVLRSDVDVVGSSVSGGHSCCV